MGGLFNNDRPPAPVAAAAPTPIATPAVDPGYGYGQAGIKSKPIRSPFLAGHPGVTLADLTQSTKSTGPYGGKSLSGTD